MHFKFRENYLSSILVFIVMFLCVINAEAADTSLKQPKKYKLSICALFKNEAPYLKEWIEYHQLVGVDHFYLYNIGSRDPYREVLAPYIRKKIVTLINWPDFLGDDSEENASIWALSTQVSAYENAVVVKASKETKWLVFLDVDEFLISPSSHRLVELLEQYDEHPGMTISSDFFDASKKDYLLPRRRLMIETLERTEIPKQNIQKTISKMIFKPDQYAGFTWPPYQCMFKNEQSPVSVKRYVLRINHYINRNVGYLFSGRVKEKLHLDHLILSDEETAELLQRGFEIEDQERAIYHFVPELLEKMGFQSKAPSR